MSSQWVRLAFVCSLTLNPALASGRPSDPNATLETRKLFDRLMNQRGMGVLLGHHNDVLEGVGWANELEHSDVKSTLEDYPAVQSFDFADLQKGYGGRFPETRLRLLEAAERGAAITMSWHMPNPITGEPYYDKTIAVPQLILGNTPPPYNQFTIKYENTLRDFANFVQSLKLRNGKAVPVIFRPFHEMNGDWFWWGRPYATAQQFIKLWKNTVHFLRDTMGIHNLLIAYSPNDFAISNNSVREYFERYPGNDYVDVLGVDIYDRSIDRTGREDFKNRFVKQMHLVVRESEKRGKIPAVTEVGPVVKSSGWWTDVFLGAFDYDAVTRKMTYALVWSNSTAENYFVPYPGANQSEVDDFIKMYQSGRFLLEGDFRGRK